MSAVTPCAYEVRAVHLDAGRKYFSASWIHRLLERIAALDLNELQLHVSDNEGYRVASAAHPEVVSPEHLSRKDLAGLVEAAGELGVRLVPALDVPGHLGAVLAHHPRLRASQTQEGSRLLDYSRPEAVALALELIDELHEMVPSTAWCLGGDEAFDVTQEAPLAERFPQLAAEAERRCGPGAHVLDGYVHFLGEVVSHLESLGITDVRAWNDALYQPGTRQGLSAQVTVGYWTDWHPSYPSLERVLAAGHRVINYSDRDLYYVLAGPGHPYAARPTAQSLAGWNPRRFPARPDGTRQDPQGDTPWLRGASMAVWCDDPGLETPEQVWQGLEPAMEAFARIMQG
ncbi:family 20 glycosylhydrolase [Actinomyces urogenitalis]|uniref:family 20 glycosylhydrolase n=1 Tax=Actinomyces urogenitalis TaxID=103621 RepID=UPI0028FE03B1|nr:family 20 glycosylhydrolase [Actinomyces urogenitalis]MDU0865130.1 family 20 glycosylhydrolase [Actinomyces urogenitalis]MDU0875615.1 family 20 glycosylhydrolase [Actinomyces urogenitalis]MDU1565262.1 family 20 glycosylhydrolase [Actinomyces urogenitalis]MDU1640677.1 family 20 glycosylhydrolase [Actinomyces urogenitalis]MDU6778378.1 family 20 glycosylhydrolase [Actinomyces urogenitalis]